MLVGLCFLCVAGKVEEDRKESLNLSDLNLKKLKLTEEDALALSYLTPGLSRRIQKQLFASLPASEARKISRTLSMREEGSAEAEKRRVGGSSSSSTLPRRFSFDKQNLPNSFVEEGNSTSPRYREYRSKYSLRSPDSSISEISSMTDDSFPYGPESTSLGKYVHPSSILENTKSLENPKPTRKISRFLRSDFYDPPREDNLVVKEKKEREMETQKVLKEIRDKRIKNRISMRRERSLSREKSLDGNGNEEKMVRCKDLVDALTATTQDKLRRLEENKRTHTAEDQKLAIRGLKDKATSDDGIEDQNYGGREDAKSRHNTRRTVGDDSGREDDKVITKGTRDNRRLKTTTSDENPIENAIVREDGSDQVNCNTESLLQDVSNNIRNIESNVLSNSQHGGTVKKERISKLVRPKSYPTENGNPKPAMNAKLSPDKSPTELNQKCSEIGAIESKLSGKKTSSGGKSSDVKLNRKSSSDVSSTKLNDMVEKSLEIKSPDNKCIEKSSEPNEITSSNSRLLGKSSEIKLPETKSPDKKFSDNRLPKKSPSDMKFIRSSDIANEKSFETTSPDNTPDAKSVEMKFAGKTLTDSTRSPERIPSDVKTNAKIDTMGSGIKTNEKPLEKKRKQSEMKSPGMKFIGKSPETMTTSGEKSNGKLSELNKSNEKSCEPKSPHRKSSPVGKSSETSSSGSKVLKKSPETVSADPKVEANNLDDKFTKSPKKKSPQRDEIPCPETKAKFLDSIWTDEKSKPEQVKQASDTKLNEKSKTTKLKKSSAAQQQQQQPTDKPRNKFLHSIEKKIEKLRTFNSSEDKKSGGVETTIKRLREQSVPRSVDHITESTLIKRAVSVEDFSNVKHNNKTLQPSRKSVTKILGLFKKYEDRTPKEENGDLGNITETNIPKPVEKERPKSLQVEKAKPVSKLPVNSYRKSLNLENNNNEPDSLSDRKNLKLDLSNVKDVNLNRISYTTDESSTLLSPCDETTSCDSWSVCSDYHHTQDLSSPLSPNGNTYSGDENESVIDRIRRKSFYTRFNDKPKPKPRKSLIGNYKDLDLYKEYNQKTLPRYKIPSDYKRNSGYSSSGEMEHEYRPYARSKSVSSEYSGIPNRYQTYNPRRSNASSLYAHEDANMEDLSTTGIYKKYSYTPNTSRLGSLSRASRSPSSDFQYIPHPHTSTSSPPQTTENGHAVTEHAV